MSSKSDIDSPVATATCNRVEFPRLCRSWLGRKVRCIVIESTVSFSKNLHCCVCLLVHILQQSTQMQHNGCTSSNWGPHHRCEEVALLLIPTLVLFSADCSIACSTCSACVSRFALAPSGVKPRNGSRFTNLRRASTNVSSRHTSTGSR